MASADAISCVMAFILFNVFCVVVFASLRAAEDTAVSTVLSRLATPAVPARMHFARAVDLLTIGLAHRPDVEAFLLEFAQRGQRVDLGRRGYLHMFIH